MKDLSRASEPDGIEYAVSGFAWRVEEIARAAVLGIVEHGRYKPRHLDERDWVFFREHVGLSGMTSCVMEPAGGIMPVSVVLIPVVRSLDAGQAEP